MSLKKVSGDALRLIYASAYRLHWITLNPLCPNQKELDKRIHNPQPGDWVLEVTRLGLCCEMLDRRRFGRLILVTEELVPLDESVKEKITEKVHYIENVDGRLIRWVNCSFIRVMDTELDETIPHIYSEQQRRDYYVQDAMIRFKLKK